MAHGILWLPLLVAFIWLAWAGWNEYQKLEAYRQWAEAFDNAKYDIYAVLGLSGNQVTWGQPSRKGPVNLQTFSLSQVESIQPWMGDRPVDPKHPPTQERGVSLKFNFFDQSSVQVPFTELSLAIQWANYLQQQRQAVGSASEQSSL